MPAEKFYLSGQVQGDGQPPDLTISWGTDHDGGSSVLITTRSEQPLQLATPTDTAGLSRLLRALTRARTHMVQNRGAQPLVEIPDWLKADHTKPKPRPVEVIDNGPDQMPTHWGTSTPDENANQIAHVFEQGEEITGNVEAWLTTAPPLTIVSDTNGREWKRRQADLPPRQAQWVGLGHRGVATHEHLAKSGPLKYVGTLGPIR